MKKRSIEMKFFLEKEMMTFTKSMIILVLFSYLHSYGCAISLPDNVKIPALQVFGDSIVDTGNNNYIPTLGRANFLPYGRDFEGGKPTGRFSNGKIPSDLFAEEFGIKELVPPYLDPNLQISDLLTGVSFASGGSGYDPETPKIANVLSLEDQLKMFKRYINKLNASVGENTTQTILSESVYLVCASSNDITVNYFGLTFRKFQYDVSSYTGFLVNRASIFIQELYSLGARRILVINAPPCGCLPAQRTLEGGLLRECVTEQNEAAILFNTKLSSELNSLNQMLSGSRIAIFDSYNPLLKLIDNPSKYGFEVANKGCCGTGKIEVAFLCNKFDLGTCPNASNYVFWDSFHPTEASYRFIIQEVLPKVVNDLFDNTYTKYMYESLVQP